MATRGERMIRKDMSYSPGSDSEVAQRQDEPAEGDATDVDRDAVAVAPGTGGPDDAGDVDIENAELHVPGREPAGTDPDDGSTDAGSGSA